MEQVVIFSDDNGGVSILMPSQECLKRHTIEEIAEKDVPSGKPFKIVSRDIIPSDRTFRKAWEVDESKLTDGVGSPHNVFVTDPQHPNNQS